MSDLAIHVDRLAELAGAVCNKIASENEFVELDTILLADQASCSRYLSYCRIHVALRLELRARRQPRISMSRSISSRPFLLWLIPMPRRSKRRPLFLTPSSPPRSTPRSAFSRRACRWRT